MLHSKVRQGELDSRVSETPAAAWASTGTAKLYYAMAVVGWRTPRLGVSHGGPPGVHTVVMDTGPGEVVLDTNVFVAAGFNPSSHSARLVEAVRDGRLRMVWDDATHTEIEHVMRQIPRLSWARIADLFRSEDRFAGSTHPEEFGFVPDPADRKFAALADAVRAPLVTSDAGLLNAGGEMAVPVLTPSEFARRFDALHRESGSR